jgi:hypothetical protein
MANLFLFGSEVIYCMNRKSSNSVRREYIAKLTLMTIFLSGFVLFIVLMLVYGPGLAVFQLGWLELALLTLATYRLSHLLSYDRVMEPVRQFFTETLPDPTGAGETVEPKGEGFQQAIGQWFCCPICTGTWVAAGLVYALYLFPDPTRVFITIMAVIGAAEIINSATEAWSWTGQHARTLSGAQMLARQKQIVQIESPCPDVLPENDLETRVITKELNRRRDISRR